jgi:hypothetical protein
VFNNLAYRDSWFYSGYGWTLDGLKRHDADAVCRVLAPEVQAAIAAGMTCEAALPGHLHANYPRLEARGVYEVPGPPGNPRFNVDVTTRTGLAITVGRYWSIWRVVDGGGLIG